MFILVKKYLVYKYKCLENIVNVLYCYPRAVETPRAYIMVTPFKWAEQSLGGGGG